MALAICLACSRHRRAADDACPFCGEGALVVTAVRPVRSGATRAALVFGGVALGASFGCVTKGDVYGAPPPPPRDAGAALESPVPAYGAPPPPPVDAATVPTLTPAPPYGAPPPRDVPAGDASPHPKGPKGAR